MENDFNSGIYPDDDLNIDSIVIDDDIDYVDEFYFLNF